MVSSVYSFFLCGFIGDMGHTNVQMRKCTNSCSRLNESSASLHIFVMVVAQLFEVTVAADGTELHSKRVSKLSLRYHRHKKQLRQLRQSAMMAELPSDTWVCPKCSYKNQDYQRCMGPGCDEVRPGGLLDTPEFALSTQPPTSSNQRSTISVAKSHPAAAAARRSKNLPPPR